MKRDLLETLWITPGKPGIMRPISVNEPMSAERREDARRADPRPSRDLKEDKSKETR